MEQNSHAMGFHLGIAKDGDLSVVPFLEAVSPSMRAVETVIRELANSSVPVLLVGERGTGKKAIAQRIHQNSSNGTGAFDIKSCRDLSSEELVIAFLPSGTTLYLDEIGDLTPECQKKLLEALSKQGSNGSGRKEVRIICSSSRDLEGEVRQGRFREDLYYRLSGVCLRIPPLRQRKEDVPSLTAFFLARYSQLFRQPLPPISPATQKLFSE